MLSLISIDLLRMLNHGRVLVNPNRPFAHKPFPPGSGEMSPELIEQRRALTALTVASALAVVVSFCALITVEVFIPV